MMSDPSAILMPKLGLTMTEGVLASWAVQPGQSVKTGDLLFVVETDKIATDVEADRDGVIETILAAAGETVPVGAPVARWTGARQAAPAAMDLNQPAPSVEKKASLSVPSMPAPMVTAPANRRTSTPLARKLAKLNDIDWQALAGSGPGGRVKAQDVQAAIARRTDYARADSDGVRKLSPLQSSAARRLTEAKRDIPHFYVLAEADVTALATVRDLIKTENPSLKITYTHFFLLAMSRALMRMPDFNVRWCDDGIVGQDAIDIGVAVDTPRGLLAPVLRDVGSLSLSRLASKLDELLARAHAGNLTADELEGGALSLSNVGMLGASYLVPIINPGQSAILGVGKIKPCYRPDKNGLPELRQEVGLTLSCDHRVHDGAAAARFLQEIVSLIERPMVLLSS